VRALLGSIEAGGTKFVCAVGDHDLNIQDKVIISTKNPDETFNEVFSFFDQYELEALGVGSFGPIDVKQNSETYGYITNTPKEGWQHVDVVGLLKNRYSVPIGWTTDVNAAALGEYNFGSAKETTSCIYITVGTGIGGGAVIDGAPLEGFGHPEMGHLLLRPHPKDSFEGNCPIHKNCLEGLASGNAIEERFGEKAQTLGKNHIAWEIESDYLAQTIMNLTLILRPERIVLGGGVMKQKQLFPMIREKFSSYFKQYVELPPLYNYLVSPSLGDAAGIIGGMILAKKELE